MALFLDILKVLIGIIIGGVTGFFLARNYMKKYMKKNPPINEQMMKGLYYNGQTAVYREDLEIPKRDPDRSLIKIILSAVCSTGKGYC